MFSILNRIKLPLKFIFITVSVLSVLFALVIHQTVFSNGDADASVPLISATESELRHYWEREVKNNPADVVYDSFVESYIEQDENRWHWAMHVLASILYDRYGADALEFCDNSFQNACYHEIMSSFSYEGKVVEQSEIATLCEGNWNCSHGIGHGLVMYYGYDQETLTGILERCPIELSVVPIESCQSGVFMEFITRTMGAPRGELDAIKNTVDKDLCSEIEPAYRGPCHFVMVEFVVAHTDPTKKEVADAIGEYCRQFAVGYEDDCFIGAGFNAKFLTKEYTEGISLCKDIAGGQGEHEDSCLGALAMQYMFFNRKEISEMICDEVSLQGRETCLSNLF